MTDNMLVLVVEDSAEDVYLISRAFEEAGLDCEFQVAEDGERAFRWIESMEAGGQPRPSIVLLDLNIPRRSGDEVLERFRQSPGGEQIPVVIMTSSESRADHEQALALGATEYFRKPSSLSEFMQLGSVVRRLCA
jgi:CheY-like chemotaxis protein